VAAALKHCALEKDEHFYLADELGLVQLIVEALCQPDDVDRMDRGDRDTLEAFLHGKLPETRREPEPDVALLLLETLYCFCATRRIRRQLKSAGVYHVVRDLDLAFSGVSPHESASSSDPQGILVTTDDGGEPAEDEDVGVVGRISRVCADLADMLLRDDETETSTSSSVACDTNFSPETVPSAAAAAKKNENLFKAGFLNTAAAKKKSPPSKKKKSDDKKGEAPHSVVVTDEELAAKIDAFDLPD